MLQIHLTSLRSLSSEAVIAFKVKQSEISPQYRKPEAGVLLRVAWLKWGLGNADDDMNWAYFTAKQAKKSSSTNFL